ncbi:MAG: hypothetical protein ACX939_09335 [Hyphococcus sp.]
MAAVISHFRLISLAALAAGLAACAEQETDAPEDEANAAPAQAAPTAQIQADAETASASEQAESAPAPFLRPADYYRLEWRDEEELCSNALAMLNAPYAPAPSNPTQGALEKGYAFRQAQRALGADGTVDWRAGEAMTGVRYVETAAFDYFNDGVARQVVRLHSRLSGSDIIGLGVIETAGANPTLLSYGHAGANTKDAPAQDNLHTKLTYSVADVVRLNGGHYTLLAALEDIDASGRVYLIRWLVKEGRAAPYAPADYYPAIGCIFQPAASEPVTDR